MNWITKIQNSRRALLVVLALWLIGFLVTNIYLFIWSLMTALRNL